MNLFELSATVQGFIQFIQFFLYVNQNNPVRHVFVALYMFMFYHYLFEKMTKDNSTMHQNCLIPDMELGNHTHGKVM